MHDLDLAVLVDMLHSLEHAPQVPRHLYVQLVQSAEVSVGSLRAHGAAKGELREYFFASLRQHEPTELS